MQKHFLRSLRQRFFSSSVFFIFFSLFLSFIRLRSLQTFPYKMVCSSQHKVFSAVALFLYIFIGFCHCLLWMRFCYLNSVNTQNDSLKWYLRSYYELTESTSTLLFIVMLMGYWGNMPTWKTHSSLSFACVFEQHSLSLSLCLRAFGFLCHRISVWINNFYVTVELSCFPRFICIILNTSYISVDKFKWKLQPQSHFVQW